MTFDNAHFGSMRKAAQILESESVPLAPRWLMQRVLRIGIRTLIASNPGSVVKAIRLDNERISFPLPIAYPSYR